MTMSFLKEIKLTKLPFSKRKKVEIIFPFSFTGGAKTSLDLISVFLALPPKEKKEATLLRGIRGVNQKNK